ncbi:uncharacterized protein PHALS_02924 [Plasmopara halstedii]|uniref:Uncharacterized protein n=1 Tax=Plasmopara halstedii TaxID=4781 RepID=A0A0P1AXH2_PLAHL|nr:uncharacterized protein PHALS_02924 [Plasmopara halstedii]CEG46524.1 hypothetical protein PHALS_02924 [Plasmopara halstedii]|eukprot:XP_024582893.1 hypothetical protein PHALS_02924 [Plasmopara halstedii]
MCASTLNDKYYDFSAICGDRYLKLGRFFSECVLEAVRLDSVSACTTAYNFCFEQGRPQLSYVKIKINKMRGCGGCELENAECIYRR